MKNKDLKDTIKKITSYNDSLENIVEIIKSSHSMLLDLKGDDINYLKKRKMLEKAVDLINDCLI